jgi:hypothetical protein
VTRAKIVGILRAETPVLGIAVVAHVAFLAWLDEAFVDARAWPSLSLASLRTDLTHCVFG